ncbi:MAG: FAD-binding protein [Kiritimatiellae bacterium]|nr:FAD-binding protein [Kiritimatiellia bacterium]
MTTFSINCNNDDEPVLATRVHTLIVGSGAAGLNAAVQLKRHGIDDLLIVTEGLKMGTSINTGSDKQTYYKMSLCSGDGDSPYAMAESYLNAGGMHGDLALVESALSTRAFFNLVQLGVRFPQDRWGQFPGYKTDHDPARRATSVGPYTSREMCLALIAEVQRLKIAVQERCYVHKLLTVKEGDNLRVCGALAVNAQGKHIALAADNIIFAVGGPGALYQTSVYPAVQTGAIGVALEAGAVAQNLQESQYGLASTQFRWNLSGSYMQVIPTFFSTADDGVSDVREFLRDTITEAPKLCGLIFRKGYQWPFDVRKVKDGSSLIDLLVYNESVIKGRRVFMDFRINPTGFEINALDSEAHEYLARSGALQATPIARLEQMNPGAVELYRTHKIDLHQVPLEIALCAQHNNGGLAANHWWESVNIKGLFPIGEVNGSHGVARPGGSALNAGQVGGIRAAEYIASRGNKSAFDLNDFEAAAEAALRDTKWFLKRCKRSKSSLEEGASAMRARMSRAGAQIRSAAALEEALEAAQQAFAWLQVEGCAVAGKGAAVKALNFRQLSLAQLVYLETILYYVGCGAGSRGSAMVVKDDGIDHPHPEEWLMEPENPEFREMVLESVFEDGATRNQWVGRRPLPVEESWFERVWADYRAGRIF